MIQERTRHSDSTIVEKIRRFEEIPSWAMVGLRVEDAGPGWAELRLPFHERLLQAMGRVHGGFIAMLIDSAVAAALWPTVEDGQAITTVDLKVNYVRPAVDQDLLAIAHVRHRGRTTGLADCSVVDAATRKEIAFGVALYMIVPA
ncbi:thioesterase superfamily protein [Kyrpidia tusciae DSM 2912]|uniref:Thioesterase superfamily protein n=1 Tax=Kyrpidia tusciae (strain DSM 2912 / NBRC 15312 / T2) TaxID=562970 RepID=D5WQ25_KYRT2|nr:thioesterase superfamily protein [Kyrpidia tusciae DSM 2912]